MTEMEMSEEHRSVRSPMEEKVGNKRKAKAKERKDNVCTRSQKPPEEQWTSGSWEEWSDQSWQTVAATVRAGEKMTGTHQSRVNKHQQQLKNFNMSLSVN